MTEAVIIALLERIAIGVEGLRHDLRQSRAAPDHADLLAVWREWVGPSPMSAGALLTMVREYESGELAAVVRRRIDIDRAGAAVSLGRLLARLPWLVNEPRGNVLFYRLRDITADPDDSDGEGA